MKLNGAQQLFPNRPAGLTIKSRSVPNSPQQSRLVPISTLKINSSIQKYCILIIFALKCNVIYNLLFSEFHKISLTKNGGKINYIDPDQFYLN